MSWKHLVYGFFSALGVLAFLSLVANEIESRRMELEHMKAQQKARLKALSVASSKGSEREAA